jgi:hypothetical protein
MPTQPPACSLRRAVLFYRNAVTNKRTVLHFSVKTGFGNRALTMPGVW